MTLVCVDELSRVWLTGVVVAANGGPVPIDRRVVAVMAKLDRGSRGPLAGPDSDPARGAVASETISDLDRAGRCAGWFASPVRAVDVGRVEAVETHVAWRRSIRSARRLET
jgi:hypothetical protein